MYDLIGLEECNIDRIVLFNIKSNNIRISSREKIEIY